MKLTNNDLRRIIKEELTAVLRETGDSENVDLWQTMTKLHNLISKGSGQLSTISEEDISFFTDGERKLEGFSVSDAIKQLEGKPVKSGKKTLKPWKRFELYDGYWVHKTEDTAIATREPEKKYPNLSQSEEVFFSLDFERPETLEFHMRVIQESGEETMVLEIQGQNVHENLEEILSYFVAPKEDILEMLNEWMRLGNLPKTSLP